MAITYTDPLEEDPILTSISEVERNSRTPIIDYSGNSTSEDARNPFFSPGKPYVAPPAAAAPPVLPPLSFTPPPLTVNQQNQAYNNWSVGTGTGKIAKPDGTMVANPFGLTQEQIYFALAGEPDSIRRLGESIGGYGPNADPAKKQLFHSIVNYYESGGQGFASGDYTPADAARAQYNYRQGMRTGVDEKGNKLGQKVTQGTSPDAIAFQLANGSIVKGTDGEYYYPADPYYSPGGGGYGTNEGDVYTGKKTYDEGIKDFGKPGSGGTTPPGGGPVAPNFSLDAENPWFSKMKQETAPPPAATTPPPAVVAPPAAQAVAPTVGQLTTPPPVVSTSKGNVEQHTGVRPRAPTPNQLYYTS